MGELDARESHRRGPIRPEAEHGTEPARDRPVALLDDIVQVLAVADQDVDPPPIFSTEPAQRPMALLVPIQPDLMRLPWRARCHRLAEKGHRGSDSALSLKERLNRLSLRVDGAVEIARLRPSPNVSRIDTPGRAGRFRAAVPPPLVFRDVLKHPAHDRRVADVHASLDHQGDEIAVAEAVGKVPTNTALDDLSRKSPAPVDGLMFKNSRQDARRAKARGYRSLAVNGPGPAVARELLVFEGAMEKSLSTASTESGAQ